MKKIKSAFTLIELLVVVSIIALVSITGINSFFDFADKSSMSIKTNNIKDNIQLYNDKIKNKEIFDYTFEISTNYKKNYFVYTDIFQNENSEKLELNYKTNTDSEISFTGKTINPSDTFYVNIYEAQKLVYSTGGTVDKKILYNFKNDREYTIKGISVKNNGGNIEKKYIGSISIKNFDTQENTMQLTDIQISTSSQPKVLLKNIFGKKEIYNNSTATGFSLFFEENEKENFINITLD